MQNSSAPIKFEIPFANAGTANTIPIPSQIGITTGAASLTDGFPPITFTPLSSGGQPPFGADMNGILKALSAGVRWANAGGVYSTDSTFQAGIGGYPKGAIVANSSFDVLFQSTTENNTNYPDAGGAGWKNLLGNFAAAQIYPFGTVLTWNDCGKVLLLGSGNFTLPLISACASGSKIKIKAGGPVVISPQGSDTIVTNTVTVTSITLATGESIELASASGTGWVLVGGSGLNATNYSQKITAGLQFGNSTTISSNLNSSNALNYYETNGIFVPNVVGATTAGTTTYTFHGGYYTRVGNVVNFTIFMIWTSATGTGDLTITGLPFASAQVAACPIWYSVLNVGSGKQCVAFLTGSSIYLYALDPTGSGIATPVSLTSNTTTNGIRISGSYLV